MWILSFIPDSILQMAIFAIIASGIVLYMFSFLLRLFPTLIPYLQFIRIFSLLLIIVGVYFAGGYGTEMEWRKRVEDMQAKIAKSEQESKNANEKINTKTDTETKWRLHEEHTFFQFIIFLHTQRNRVSQHYISNYESFSFFYIFD